MDKFYHELEEVRGIIDSRQSLRREVEIWWAESGAPFPECFRNGWNYGLLARHVPTFRYEDAAFVLLAEAVGLCPVWLGYTEDKFVDISPVKHSLLRPMFVTRIGRNGGVVVKREHLANPMTNNGHNLDKIMCRDGRPLVEYHRGQLQALYPQALIGDISRALEILGGRASRYYPYFLGLAVAHVVLFEDYHAGESGPILTDFTREVFEPAFKEVEKKFGMRPLVVKLPWWPELGFYPHPDLSRLFSWRCHSFALKHLAIRL